MSVQPRRRVLFVDHAPVIGGAQLALVEHLRELDRGRFEALVACTDDVPDLVDRYRDAGAEIIYTPLPRLRRFNPLVLVRLFSSALALRRVCGERRVDLVVASTSRAAYIAAAALIGTGTPLIWWVHDFQFNRALFRLVSPLAAGLMCVSAAVRDFYGGRRDSRFRVVPVGTTLHRALASLQPATVGAERQRWGFGDDEVVIGFMGRLVAEKGPEDLLDAVAELHRRDSRIRLLVVGTGHGQVHDVEDKLREQVVRNGWTFVRFAGFQRNEALYYRLFDILVLPSRSAEGYAMSALQAMIAGTPVVVTNVGGMPELVQHRVTGMLVRPSAPPEIVDAVSELLADDELRTRLTDAALAQVTSRNRVEVTTRCAERLYDDVTAASRAV